MPDDVAETLSARLSRLEDLEEIRQLYVDYGRHLDAGDAAAYASLFSIDAKLRLGRVMRATGRDEIFRVATEVVKARPDGVKPPVHVLGSPRIDLDGDTATGEAVWVAIGQAGSGPPSVRVGRHADKLVREDSHWRLAERRGFIDIGAFG